MAKKKAASKKKTSKKAAAKKTANKASAKKTPAKKTATKKAAAKKAPAKKSTAKKAPAKKASKKKATVKTIPAPLAAELLDDGEDTVVIKPRKIPAKMKKQYRELLQKFRDQVVDDISFLAGDNLNRSARETSGDLSSYSYHMADQGTDNFDREFALNRVSSEQDVLYEIDEALRRLEIGTYGICELTGADIEEERLKAIPHTRYCLRAQAELEKSRTRYRPFGPTIMQTERF